MIPASNFRIGNWISYEGKLTLLRDVLSGFHYEPIPLTPEILEKAGFKKGEPFYISHEDTFYLGDRYFWVQHCFCHKTSHESAIVLAWWVKYVHQLQNLYFALTGEELEINL
jgi:hypothetical protein